MKAGTASLALRVLALAAVVATAMSAVPDFELDASTVSCDNTTVVLDLSHATSMVGTVVISGIDCPNLLEIDLRNVKNGGVQLTNSVELETLRLDSLEDGGSIIVSGSIANGIYLPKLHTLLYLTVDPRRPDTLPAYSRPGPRAGIPTIDLPLVEVVTSVQFHGVDDNTKWISMPKLKEVYYFYVTSSTTDLFRHFTSALPRIAELKLNDNTGLETVVISRASYIKSITLERNPALTSVRGDVQFVEGFLVRDCPLLTVLAFNELLMIKQSFYVLGAPSLVEPSFPKVCYSRRTTVNDVGFTEPYTTDGAGCYAALRELEVLPGVDFADTGIPVNATFPNAKVAEGPLYLTSQTVERIAFPALTTALSHIMLQSSSKLISFEFPMLRYVDQVVYIRSLNVLEAVRFPELERVGRELLIDTMNSVTVVEFPKLNYVGEDLKITKLSSFRGAFVFPELASLGRSLVLQTLATATGYEFPNLVSIPNGRLQITSMRDVQTFDFSRLKHLRWGLSLSTLNMGPGTITTMEFPALETFDEGAQIWLSSSTSGLQTISCPKLHSMVGGRLQFNNAADLTTVLLPSLREVGSITLSFVGKLATFDLSNLCAVTSPELGSWNAALLPEPDSFPTHCPDRLPGSLADCPSAKADVIRSQGGANLLVQLPGLAEPLLGLSLAECSEACFLDTASPCNVWSWVPVGWPTTNTSVCLLTSCTFDCIEEPFTGALSGSLYECLANQPVVEYDASSPRFPLSPIAQSDAWTWVGDSDIVARGISSLLNSWSLYDNTASGSGHYMAPLSSAVASALRTRGVELFFRMQVDYSPALGDPASQGAFISLNLGTGSQRVVVEFNPAPSPDSWTDLHTHEILSDGAARSIRHSGTLTPGAPFEGKLMLYPESAGEPSASFRFRVDGHLAPGYATVLEANPGLPTEILPVGLSFGTLGGSSRFGLVHFHEISLRALGADPVALDTPLFEQGSAPAPSAPAAPSGPQHAFETLVEVTADSGAIAFGEGDGAVHLGMGANHAMQLTGELEVGGIPVRESLTSVSDRVDALEAFLA